MSAARILSVYKDGEKITEARVEGEAWVGRGDQCVIRLDDRAVSRKHLSVRPHADGVIVEKKSEFAPFSVNGVEATQAVVKQGDVIAIGPYQLRVREEEAAPVASQPLEQEAPPVSEAVSPDSTAIVELGSNGEPTEEPVTEEPAAFESPAPVEFPGSEPPVEADSALPDEDARTRIVSATGRIRRLVFREGDANVKDFELSEGSISIGRGKKCDVVLNDKRSSRKHAVIEPSGSDFVIRDLGSVNGILVNGAKATEHRLESGDRLRVGDIDFSYEEVSSDYLAKQAELGAPEAQGAFEPLESAQPFEAQVPQMAGISFEQPPSAVDFGADPSSLPMPSVDQLAAVPLVGGTGASFVGMTPEKPVKQSLWIKYVRNFSKLEPRQKLIAGGVILGLAYLAPDIVGDFLADLFLPDSGKKTSQRGPASVGPKGFDQLTPEDKKFVENQHRIAFEYFGQHDYDRAIYEAEKILKIIPEYKNTTEIIKFSKIGKAHLEAMKEEEKRKEEERKIKQRVDEIVAQIGELMKKKDYAGARDWFGEVLALDPENAQVAIWKKEVDEYELAQRLLEQERSVQAEIHRRARDSLSEAKSLRNKGKCHEAIRVYASVQEMGVSDKEITRLAQSGIASCRSSILSKLGPVLEEAQRLESENDFSPAYKLYEKASQIDPGNPSGRNGMARIRGILHERSKHLYTEAVIAESYSDFAAAETKFREILTTAPRDDIYFARAQKKLEPYQRARGPAGLPGGSQGPSTGGSE